MICCSARHRDLELVLAAISWATDEVVARLRLVRVGDGRGADLEVALRLRELLGDRDLLRAMKCEVVLRGEHVEVGLRHAHDQVLRRLAELRLGLQHLELRLLVLDDVLPAEDRLRQRQRCNRSLLKVAMSRLPVTFRASFQLRVRRAVDHRQQQRPALRQLLQARLQAASRAEAYAGSFWRASR